MAGCDVRDELVRAPASREAWPKVISFPAVVRAEIRTEPAAAAGIEYVEGYEAGARQARTAGLPLLLVFRAAWCRWSGELARGSLADPALVARSRRLVCVTVDADRDAVTCREFGVRAFPTLIVIDAEGRERHRATGADAGVDLTARLEEIIALPERVADETREPRTR